MQSVLMYAECHGCTEKFTVCVCVCVASRIGFCSVFAISRLSAHAGFDLHLSFNSVRGFGGMGGGVMTSMRLRLVFSFSAGDLLLLCCGAVQWWGGGHLEANADQTNTIVLVVISGYSLLDFAHVYHAKTSSFCSFPDKNFATDPKIEQKKHEKHGICDTFTKNATKKQEQKRWKTQTPKRRVVDENLAKHRVFVLSTKKPPKHKRHTPRGGKRITSASTGTTRTTATAQLEQQPRQLQYHNL